MQVGVQRAARVIGHQNLHLAFRQVLDVLVKGACFSAPEYRPPDLSPRIVRIRRTSISPWTGCAA